MLAVVQQVNLQQVRRATKQVVLLLQVAASPLRIRRLVRGAKQLNYCDKQTLLIAYREDLQERLGKRRPTYRFMRDSFTPLRDSFTPLLKVPPLREGNRAGMVPPADRDNLVKWGFS